MGSRFAVAVLCLFFVVSMAVAVGLDADTVTLEDSGLNGVDGTGDSDSDTGGLLDGDVEKFIVRTAGDPGPVVDELEDLGVTVRYEYELIDAVAVEMVPALLETVEDVPGVEAVEDDAVIEPVLVQSTSQINAQQVWDGHGETGDGVVIAVLDTGIAEHDDLENVVDRQDFTGEGDGDEHGHGTHVASTAAGSGAASAGTYRGVADGADLMDVKVLDRTGAGHMSDAIAGMEYATGNGADILSLSIGASIPCDGNDAMSLAADTVVERGVVVVAAAGNSGPAAGTITSPGCAENVITVGAVDATDSTAAFSSRGPTADGRAKPDVVAPGVLIGAASNDGGYTTKSGTSMATPHVAGVAALLLAADPGLSPERVKTVVMETAADIGEDRYAQGAGRVDAEAAFADATDAEPGAAEADRDRERDDASSTARESEGMEEVTGVEQRERNGTMQYRVTGLVNGTFVDVWVDPEGDRVVAVEPVGTVRSFVLHLQHRVSSLLAGLFS